MFKRFLPDATEKGTHSRYYAVKLYLDLCANEASFLPYRHICICAIV